jgi:hypothetical protein
MHPLNGLAASPNPQPIRIIWFGESVVSDWNNPVATTTRAVMRALGRSGHDVVFHERRNNAPMLEAMNARGSAMYRAFQTAYPDIQYRTYDLPKRNSERTVWMARETAIAEAVIVQDSAPDEVLQWLDRFSSAKIVTVYQRTSTERKAPEPRTDLVLSPMLDDDACYFGPAVLAEPRITASPRGEALTVAYCELNDRVSNAVSTGPGNPHLDFLPEALLASRYSTCERVTIVDDDPSPYAIARAYLPLANGVPSVTYGTSTQKGKIVDGFNDAQEQAFMLVNAIHDALAARRERSDLNEPA